MTAPATSSGVASGGIRRRIRARGVFVRAAVVGTAVAAALAGCGDQGDPTATRPEPAAAPVSPPAPEPSPASPGQDGASTPSDEAGDPAGDDPGAGGTGAGGTGPGGTRAPGTDGTAGASSGTGEPAGAGSGDAAPALPSAMPSPVFLGEACATDRDTGPAMAVNGLVLYCVAPPGAGAGPGALGRWSVQSPQQQTQPRPEPGSECDTADVGRILQDSAGRPVACLREPDGGLRWADVS